MNHQEEISGSRSAATATTAAPSSFPVPDKAGAGSFYMPGWIKLHRQFMEWEWYSDTNVKVLFIHCLLSANFEDKKWRGKDIKRGSFITSIGNLSEAVGISKKAVRIALDKLKLTNEITVIGANKFTTITITKYDTYQQNDSPEGQTNGTQKGTQGAFKGQTKGKQRATTKELKEIEEIEEEKNEIPVGDKSPTVYQRCISSYDSFLKLRTGTPVKMNKVEGKSMKEIIAYLTTSCKQHNENATDDTIVEAWQLILDRYDQWDSFHRGQLRLAQINQNLINIINTIKNGKSGKYSAGNDLSSIDRIGAAVFAQYVSGPTTGNTGTDNR